MKINKTYKYNISDIKLKGNLLSWENHTVRSSAISHVWSSRTPAEPFPARIFLVLLFIALSSPHTVLLITMTASLAAGAAIWIYLHRPLKTAEQINIRLISGEIISFLTESNDTAEQFYEALKNLADKHVVPEIIFDKDGKLEEKKNTEAVQATPAIMEITSKNASNQRLVDELKKLYLSYEKKTDADSEILLLINDTAHLIDTGNREALKTSFKNFVTLGLVGDCNELGLDTLIQEIKANLY